MTKCSICTSRKGKRKCSADGSAICTLCCGQTRNSKKCVGCTFYETEHSNRNYRKVPYFEILEMSDSEELQDISNVIEGALCTFCEDDQFNDKNAVNLIELLLDTWFFKDPVLPSCSVVQEVRLNHLQEIIGQDLSSIPEEKLIKIFAAIYRSIQRHTNGGRAYLDFTQRYVGARVGSGMRIIKNFDTL
jgi:hypothetical protein